MQSIQANKLGSTIVNKLDKEFVDINVLVPEDPDTQEVYE
jgi:hypothetical protein